MFTRETNLSFTERAAEQILIKITEYKAPILTSWIVSFLAYTFMFTNKIPNWDDMQFLFGKGYTLTSGRWGLDLMSFVLPDYSIPWFNGILTIFLLTISVCFLLRLFRINTPILQCATAGIILVFPSEIGTLFYMFTSPSYAVAFLSAVLSVYFFLGETIRSKIISFALGCLSLSIYQAYASVMVSLFVLLVIQNLMEGRESIKVVLISGIKYILFLCFIAGFYWGILQILLRLNGLGLNAWALRATGTDSALADRVLHAWKAVLSILLLKSYGIETTEASQIVHLIISLSAGILSINLFIKRKDWSRLLLFLFLATVILPISINCTTVLIGDEGVHALTFYGFVSIYLLIILIIEIYPERRAAGIAKDLYVIASAVIIISNIYTANKAYLKQYLSFENAVSFYQSILSRIQETPGFDENCQLVILGSFEEDSRYLEFFGQDVIYGTNGFKGEAISDEFFRYYLGSDIPFADEATKKRISEMSVVKQMKPYPYYGYVQKIENYIVVKIGNE